MVVADVHDEDLRGASLLLDAVDGIERGLPLGPRLQLLEHCPGWGAILKAAIADTDSSNIRAAIGRAIDADTHPDRRRLALGKVWRARRQGDDEIIKSLNARSARLKPLPGQPRPAMGDDPGLGPSEHTGGVDLKGQIQERSGHYCVKVGSTEKVVSSFVIEPTVRVVAENTETILGVAKTDKGTRVDVQLPLRAFQSKKDLLRHLPSADLQWTGSDNNAQGLLRLLAQPPVPKCPGTTMLGFHWNGEMPLWVCSQGAITKDGLVEPSPVIYLPTGGSFPERVRYKAADDATFTSIADKVFEFLPQVNVPAVVVPVIGWFFAAPLKPLLRERVGSFPLLFLWGTQGSGKSSLVSEIFWPLFGIRDAEPYSATETEFALLKILSSTNSIPVFIDEYKPYDMHRLRRNTLHRYLRRLFRGEIEERGRPDQSVTTYRLQAPLCVAGETRPTEAALLERILPVMLAKTTLEESDHCSVAYRELKSLDLALFAPRYVQFCLGRDFDADLEATRGRTRELIGERKVPLRVVENITAMLFGVHLFRQFAQACDYSALPADLGEGDAVEAVLADLLETEHRVKNALDEFLEMLQVIAIQGEIRHGIHYVIKGDVLHVHLDSAYDSFRQHCRRVDYEREIVDLRVLRRLLHENRLQGGYVIAESERVYFEAGAERRRAVAIDLARAPFLDQNEFPSVGAIQGDGTPGWRQPL